MKRNKVRIISNKATNTISYYFQNENMEWVLVDNSSPLSRKEYTEISFAENAKKILRVIEECYNIGDRGVDIVFEGAKDEYSVLCSMKDDLSSSILFKDKEKSKVSEKKSETKNDALEHKKVLSKQKESKKNDNSKTEINTNTNINISCEHKKSKMVIAGKIKSGKSTLIEEFCKYNDIKYSKRKCKEYTLYESEDENTILYELNGIDLGREYIQAYEKTIKEIASVDMTVYIYCSATSKIEIAEERIIMNIQKNYPQVKILVALTSYVENDASLVAEQISKQMKGVKVIPMLAKELKTRQGIIPSFGLDLASRYIYGGR